ncbi:hypothetical protein C8J57DRAFT_1570933 [Mycena rebaudengoi]|nr:hypothetical protein C8J57DRAFT_1570933 [Mycena rebaudengoi]
MEIPPDIEIQLLLSQNLSVWDFASFDLPRIALPVAQKKNSSPADFFVKGASTAIQPRRWARRAMSKSLKAEIKTLNQRLGGGEEIGGTALMPARQKLLWAQVELNLQRQYEGLAEKQYEEIREKTKELTLAPASPVDLQRRALDAQRLNLEGQQRQLETGMHNIEEEQKHLESQWRDLKDGLIRTSGYPLTLPVEITSRIFLHCIDESSARPSPTRAPLLLTQICREWKEIAFATCQLWSSLVRLPAIAVGFCYPNRLPPAIFSLIAVYSPQLRSLKLAFSHSADVEGLNDIRVPFPILQDLTIDVPEYKPLLELIIFKDAPQLGRLISRVYDSTLSIYPSVTSLELQRISITQFYKIFAAFPLIQHIAVADFIGEIADPEHPSVSSR